MTDELHIVTGEQMERMKEAGMGIVKLLPADPKEAYLIILFVKKHFEDVTGFTEKGIKILPKDSGGK